ncbi:hypothetical protein KA005_04355, partial [bacterium]|nr:hypothetical protein [bacterium]
NPGNKILGISGCRIESGMTKTVDFNQPDIEPLRLIDEGCSVFRLARLLYTSQYEKKCTQLER